MRIKRVYAWILAFIMIMGLVPAVPEKMGTVEAASDGYHVRIWGIDTEKMTITSGSDNQTVEKGSPMASVTIQANSNYYFPEDYEISNQYGISVTRNEPAGTTTSITISGTPTNDVELSVQSDLLKEKSSQNSPSWVMGGELCLTGTTEDMVYADANTIPLVWKKCTYGTTTTTAGDKYVKLAGTWNKKESAYITRTVTAAKEEEEPVPTETYSVRIINPDNSHMLIDAAHDDAYQPEVSGAMEDVYYVADTGYEFPANYYVKSESGVRVERVDSRTIKVTGTPTDDVTITLKAASVITLTYHTVTVTNGSGSGKYVSGDIVTIKANTKSGMNFSRWNIKKGAVTLGDSHSTTTTFIMRNSNVEIEAYYTEATASSTGTSTSISTNTNTGTTTNTSTNTSTTQTTAISQTTYSNNSDLLDISAKVSWSGGKWKLTWSKVSGAAGYDVFAGQGKKSLKTNTVTSNLSGNGTTTTKIKTIKGKKVNKKKTYEFQIKAYRIVNRSKEYIGASRILYVAGSKNKTYTNIKKLSPVKKSITVNSGSTAKIGTYVKKEKSSKKLVTGRNGKKLQYVSSNKAVATVSSTGTVTGVSSGSCTIYVIAWNGKKTSVKVTVQ